MSRKRVGLGTGVLVLAFAAGTALGDPIYVDADVDGGNDDGSSWENAFDELCEALEDASSGDEVWVAVSDEEYLPCVNATSGRYSTIDISDPAILLYGGFQGNESVRLDCTQMGYTCTGEAGDPCGTSGTCVDVREGTCSDPPTTKCWFDYDCPVGETCQIGEDNKGASVLSGDMNVDDSGEYGDREDNAYHVLSYTVANAFARVDGFMVRGGHADNPSFPWNQGSGLTIREAPACDSGADQGKLCSLDSECDGAAECDPPDECISTFNENEAHRLMIENCMFTDNWSKDHGAVNDHGNETKIANCIFYDNHSDNRGGGLYIHSGSPVVDDCVFDSNEATSFGGGVYLKTDSGCEGYGSAPKFTDCTFENNTTASTAMATGGAGMWNEGGDPEFTNSTFENNEAQSRGGGVYNKDGVLTFTGCTFDSNSVDSTADGSGGGGIYNQDGTLTLSGCTVTDNDAARWGGGLYMNDGQAALTDCDFTLNSTDYTGTHGGSAIYNGSATLTLNDCVFEGNDTGLYAAGLWTVGEEADVLISACTFDSNTGAVGAAIYVAGGNLVAEDTLFESNDVSEGQALRYGGAVAQTSAGTSGEYIRCTFSNNKAGSAGAFYTNHSPATFVNCLFFENEATSAAGGAIENAGTSSDLRLHNCTVADNTAGTVGGGLENFDNGTVTICNSIFWGNSDGAPATEGDQITNTSGTITVTYTDIEDCDAICAELSNMDVDPGFVDEANDDYCLVSTSEVIDEGDDDCILPGTSHPDLIGNDRTRYDDGPNCIDLGACEYEASTDCCNDDDDDCTDAGTPNCCSTGFCEECCDYNDCSGETPYCVSNECVECCDEDDCTGDDLCCDGTCGECCEDGGCGFRQCCGHVTPYTCGPCGH
ncbi:MAG: right-handed parallel beta-helix repeat-containing protein [Phycisphaerae bacterium]|jgi:hypothetical protein